MTLKANDLVKILPEFQDKGDDKYTWMVISDESLGQVDISPIDHPFMIKPVYLVQSSWIVKA